MAKPIKNKSYTAYKKNVGFLFISVWLIGFIVFRIYPFLSSFIYSFSDLNLFNGISEWGTSNYIEIFTDEKILKSLGITFIYTFITVPFKLAFALLIACILNCRVKGVSIFRTVYYIPSILGSSVAVSVLWKALFRDEGMINSMLASFGIDGPGWLSDSRYSLFIISLLRVWQFGSSMVIFLAALKSVPPELYEAAVIDGASRTKRFWSITFPMLTPIIFYNLITQFVQTFQEFNGPYIITGGGPRGSTTLFSLLIYRRAFILNDMGMASAMAWVLFSIVMTISIIAFISQKYWVFYDDQK